MIRAMLKIQKVLVFALLIGNSFSAFAQAQAPLPIFGDGGATSGGGNELGIFAKRALRTVAENIEQIPNLYSNDQKELIKKRIKSIKSILIVNEELPAPSANPDHHFGHVYIQQGTAWSTFDGINSEIKLNFKRFSALVDPIAIEGLLHHELAVLAGIEKTGDYTYTDQFMLYREKIWESQLAQQAICTISIFEKNGAEPGKLLGTAATARTRLTNTEGAIRNIVDLEIRSSKHKEVKSILMRYVLGGSGYFKATISRADTIVLNSTGEFISIRNLQDLTPEITFYNPYDWMMATREARFREFDFGFMMVSCSRI